MNIWSQAVAVTAHAVGYRRDRRSPMGWRSHFCADPGTRHYEACQRAVMLGMMTGPVLGRYFHATLAGLEIVSAMTGRSYYTDGWNE